VQVDGAIQPDRCDNYSLREDLSAHEPSNGVQPLQQLLHP
jgi:hypothetical protein